jgi:PAS domain S-box-containing protein
MHPGVDKTMHIQSTSPELPHRSTPGQEAQEVLEHSEERFRTLVANIPGVVYRCAEAGELQGTPLRTMVFLSEAIQNISGYPPSDFINNRVRSFSSIIHPQDRARVEQAVWQSVNVKQPYVIEYRIVRADGSLAWVYDKGQGIFSKNEEGQTQGLPLQIDGVILDITERKQTEADLYSTQAFLNSIVENLPVGVFIKDAVDLRVMYWNRASEELFGYSREEVLGKNDYDFLPQEQARYLRTTDRQILTGGQLVDIPEVPLMTPHRGERFLHTKKVPLLDETGTPRYLLGICEDITERKRSEEGLRESEAHYRRMLETASEGIWMFDADSKTTFANDRIAQMLGYTVEEMLGRSLFDFMDEESRAIAATYVERRRQGIHERHDFKFRRKDGSDLWAIVSATPILDSAGQFVGVLRMITDISDRKRTEEALQESHQQTVQILERITDAFFALDHQWRFTYINSEAASSLQRNQEEVIGASFWDVFPEAVGSLVEQQYRQAISEQVYITFETFCQRLVSWVEVRIYPCEEGLSVFWRDITKRKQAEEALRESERRFRAIFHSMFQFIGLMKPDGTLLEANQTALDFAGLQLGDIAGRPFWEARWWSLCAQTQERLKAAIASAASGEFVRYEVDVLGAGDRVVTIDFSIKPVKDEMGQVVLLIPEGRDISDKKQAEKALRDSEQRFRATFAQAAVGIAHVDLDGKFLRSNQKFCALVGYTQAEMLAKTLQDITHPDDLEADLADVRQVLSGEIQMYSIEKRYIARSGEMIWVNLTVSLRRRSSGEPKYFISVVQDISDKKQAEEALRQSESELRAKNQELQQTLRQLKKTQAQLIQNEKMVSLGQMVAGIAHEINNPISFIYGNVAYAHQYACDLLNLVQLYANHYPEPVPEIQNEIEAIDLSFLTTDFPKVLKSMKEGANRIREIVLSLRNFSRLDEAELKSVNIHEGIDNTLLILQHRLKKQLSHAEIQVRKEYGQLPLIECYAGSLNQVFMNLLTNAIDALETHPEPRVITIRTEVKDKGTRVSDEGELIHPTHILIRIADNGPGIPEDVKKHIFDFFFTTKAIGVGTGLGLSISHSIVVEKHGGQITCISSPNQGAEFVIELPVQQKPIPAGTSVTPA